MEEKVYYISKWCHSYVSEDVIALFHAVNLFVIFLPKEDGDALLSMVGRPINQIELNTLLDRETLQALIDEKLLVTNPIQDEDLLHQTRGVLRREITIELLYLLVTDNCNLRCRYCFEETPTGACDFKPATMTRETARLAIDTFARLQTKYGDPNKIKVIHLYGGEPMLNPDIVMYAVEYIELLKTDGRLPADTVITIVTNGTLMTEEQASFLARHRVTVGLSLDGPSTVNNLYRVGKRSELNVYQTAMDTYDLLVKHDVNIGLSVTLTPESVDHFSEVFNFFISRLQDTKGFALNLMHFNYGVTPPTDYYEKAVYCQLEAFKLFRERGIYEERIMRKVKAFIARKAMYADCGVVGNQLVVAPDGLIGVCQDFVKPRTYFDGSVHDPLFDPIELGTFADWVDRSPLNMNECQACPAMGICGGGCPASAELKHGSRWHLDERICFHSRKVLEWLIWDTYANQL